MSNKAAATVTIRNRLGLHARPAMMFVETACRHRSSIRIGRTDSPADVFDGKSIMQVMMLAATCGTSLELSAEGDDADVAVKELAALVESGFSED